MRQIKPTGRVITFLVVVFPAIMTASSVADIPLKNDIPRFSMLAEGIYRGGQPTAKGFQFLKDKGIKTIINLRAEDNSEAKTVEKLGMRYFQFAIAEVRPWSQLSPGA